MSLYLALWLPDLEPSRRVWVSEELDHFSDRCHFLAPERWLLNLTGLESLLGPPGVIAKKLRAHLERNDLTPRIAVAPTRAAALLTSVHQAFRILDDAPPAAALAPLPLESLRAFAGCGNAGETVAAMLELLERWGLTRLGELAGLPSRALAERLGADGLDCQRWARGEDQGLMLPDAPPPPPIERHEHFEPAVEGYLPVLPWIEAQLRTLCAALARADRAVLALDLQLTLDRRATAWEWRQTYSLPHHDARRLLRQLETALAQQPPPAPIVTARLRLLETRPRRIQGGLFGDPVQASEETERLLGRLRDLLDDPSGQRCGSPRLRDLHRSDAWVITPFGEKDPGPPSRRLPRLALRALRPPPPIGLQLPALPAIPGTARLQGAWCQLPHQAAQPVLRAAGPWRNSGEWWTNEAWSRDEWDVELADRHRYRLLYDRRAQKWFLLGEYD